MLLHVRTWPICRIAAAEVDLPPTFSASVAVELLPQNSTDVWRYRMGVWRYMVERSG